LEWWAVREREYQAFQKLRADKELIAQASRWLRGQPWPKHPERLYALAALLDTIELRLGDVPAPVRHRAVSTAWEVTGQPGSGRSGIDAPSGALARRAGCR
jgi:hypothetical protein